MGFVGTVREEKNRRWAGQQSNPVVSAFGPKVLPIRERVFGRSGGYWKGGLEAEGLLDGKRKKKKETKDQTSGGGRQILYSSNAGHFARAHVPWPEDGSRREWRRLGEAAWKLRGSRAGKEKPEDLTKRMKADFIVVKLRRSFTCFEWLLFLS